MANTLREGAQVYGSDGKKLGKVRHMFTAAAGSVSRGDVDQASSDLYAGSGFGAPEVAEEQARMVDISMDRVNAVTDAGAGITAKWDDQPRDVNVPDSPGVTFGPSQTKYFECHHGGHLGIHSECLYVPFAAVALIEDDGSVVVRFTAEEAVSLYGEKPGALDEE